MAIDFAADLRGCFSADEFGTWVLYEDGRKLVAIWTKPWQFLGFQRGETASDRHEFLVQASDLPNPARGKHLIIKATAERFRICEDPMPSTDGAMWTLRATPAD